MCLLFVDQAQWGISRHGWDGALTICPPTNQPGDNSTHTIRPPNDPYSVTIHLCDILTQSGWIVLPPKNRTLHPKNLNGLSHRDVKTHWNILSQSLWQFVYIFFVRLWYDNLSLHNKRSIFPEKFGHFYSLSHMTTDPQRVVYDVNDKPQLRQDS
jgi:hypothetical protein